MSAHAYTEDHLVERPAIGLFAALGWQTVSAQEETFGPSPPTHSPVPGGLRRLVPTRSGTERPVRP